MAADSWLDVAIFSVGYEQRTVEEVVGILVQNDVEVLVDVRLNAISRRRGFSKSALRGAVESAGIEYRHERSLGNPKENRDAYRAGDANARRAYEHLLANGADEAYRSLVDRAVVQRTALLCFERDHESCHRASIIEKALKERPSLGFEEL